MLDEYLLSSRRPGLHAVDYDHVGATLDGELDVVEDAGCAHFNVDRHSPVGNLPQFSDLDSQIIAARPVGMAARRALVDTLGQSPHRGDSRTDFLSQQNAATSRLRALPDYALERVGFPKIVRFEPIA